MISQNVNRALIIITRMILINAMVIIIITIFSFLTKIECRENTPNCDKCNTL